MTRPNGVSIEGSVRLHISVDVDDLSQWPLERVETFFSGLARVVSATSDFRDRLERGAGNMRGGAA